MTDGIEVRLRSWANYERPIEGRFTLHEPVYGRMDERGRFMVTHPRWMELRRVLGDLVPRTERTGPVVTAIDRERGVITIGRRS